MKIFIISPHFWPSNDPRSNRWSALAAYWVQQGHEVQVLTARQGRPAGEETRQGVSICRKAYKNLQDIFLRPGQRENAGKSRWFKLLYYLNEYLWKAIYWPDASALWYLPARKKALQLAAEKPDLMISVALPVTAHAVALAVKKRHPDLLWLADWGDPFSLQKHCPVNNRQLYGKLNLRLERHIFQKADALFFTSEAARKAYGKLFPQAFAKCHLTPPLLDVHPDFSAFAKYNPPEKSAPLKLMYFGSFTPGLREPLPLLRLLDACLHAGGRAIEVHFYGRLPEPLVEQTTPYPFVQHHGLLAREQVMRKMAEADILLSVGNQSELHLPSKVAGYLAAPKPVLHLRQLEADPVCEAFAGMPGFYPVNPKEGQTAVQAVVKWFHHFSPLSPQEAKRRKEAALARYSPQAIAKKYEASWQLFG